MALYPCDVDGRRYPGAGNSAYAGWAAGSYSERKRFRLCPKHIAEFRERAVHEMELVSRGEQIVESDKEGNPDCWRCGLEPHSVMSFLQIYDRNAEPEVFVMHTCPKCNSQLYLDALRASS